MTLDEAIIYVLRENEGSLHIVLITDQINDKELYVRGDYTPLTRKQVSARISRHPELFTRNQGIISLR